MNNYQVKFQVQILNPKLIVVYFEASDQPFLRCNDRAFWRLYDGISKVDSRIYQNQTARARKART
jgi:hypothetical protein